MHLERKKANLNRMRFLLFQTPVILCGTCSWFDPGHPCSAARHLGRETPPSPQPQRQERRACGESDLRRPSQGHTGPIGHKQERSPTLTARGWEAERSPGGIRPRFPVCLGKDLGTGYKARQRACKPTLVCGEKCRRQTGASCVASVDTAELPRMGRKWAVAEQRAEEWKLPGRAGEHSAEEN